MSTTVESSGLVLGFGGTNVRSAIAEHGDISNFKSIQTPTEPGMFFRWMTTQVLNAYEAGHGWVVSGFPGPVARDGKLIGPLANVSGLSNQAYDLAKELNAVDPVIDRIVAEGFSIIAVNDGELAAHAAATRIGEGAYDKPAALIVGTGVGAGVIMRDEVERDVYRADRSAPNEIGHIVLSADPEDTFENRISGPALERRYFMNPAEIPADHPAWREVGTHIGRMATLLGAMSGVDLVVPVGGVGSNAAPKYSKYLEEMLENYSLLGNATQQHLAPEVKYPSGFDAQSFEMFGGEGVMKDFQSRSVINIFG